MSSSTDSLKKKVCVTVFLDELFEEVEEEEERREPKQVSEVTDSVAKFAEKPVREPSRVDLGNDERVNVSPNADAEQNQVQVRPRKHRRESKFSKNRYDSFKNELSKYGYGSCVKVENEGREPVDSAVSDSDFDLDEFLGLDKWAVEKSRSSFSELSECDMTEGSTLSINPVLSSTVIYPQDKINCQDKSGAFIESPVLHSSKSAQFEGANREDKNCDGRVGDELSFEKEGKKAEDDLAWKKTQRQIQLILAEAKSRYQEKETCEGDCIRHYDLRSILEECVKTSPEECDPDITTNFEGVRSSASTDYNESDVQELSDSYTYVFPHSKQSLQSLPPEVRKVWANTKRNVWNDGFESDLSEADCIQYTKDIGVRSIQNDSLLCYTLSLKRTEHESPEKEGETGRKEPSAEKLKPSASRSSKKPTYKESSFEGIKSKAPGEASLVFQAVAHLTDRTIPGTVLKTEQEKREGVNEGDLSVEAPKAPSAVEGRNKNFAEGDTIEKPIGRDSKFILDLEAKEKLLVCDEILKHVGESKVIRNEIIVNRAEIELHPQGAASQGKQERAETPNPSAQTTTASEVLAEVFFNQNRSESMEKNMTDAESEMVFAESENFCDSDDFFCGRYSVGPAQSFTPHGNQLQKDICVVEFEDKLSRSKILRRMKTVEILGDNSLNDMKNISTEVILICENISNNEVCMEAWQSSTSTLRSLSEMKQCYLKDSRDSAMYLIEIPLHFTNAKKEKPAGSENFFKPSDSD